MHLSNDASVIFGISRSIGMSTRHLLARVKAERCYDCWRAIRWWNRRVQLVDSDCHVHLQCWKDQLFFKQLVADNIRSVHENSALSRSRSSEDELQNLRASTAQ